MLGTHFQRREFTCKCGCGFDTVDAELLNALEALRNHFRCAVYITSACRCLDYNRSIGSKDTSQHVKGRAADIIAKKATPEQVYKYLIERYPDKFGIGRYDDFTHIDTKSGPARRWDNRTNK